MRLRISDGDRVLHENTCNGMDDTEHIAAGECEGGLGHL